MFVTYQPARIIGTNEKTLASKKTEKVGDEGLSSRLSLPEGIVVSGVSQPDKTKGYVTKEDEILEISGEVTLYNPTDSAKTVYIITSDTF